MKPKALWLTANPVERHVLTTLHLGTLEQAKREPDRVNESDSLATNPHYRKGA